MYDIDPDVTIKRQGAIKKANGKKENEAQNGVKPGENNYRTVPEGTSLR